MPAYYDGELFTVNMLRLPARPTRSSGTIELNTIYASNDLDDEQDFIPVIDAIQGDGFNPLWQQVLIVFNAGFTPHQFFSDEEIEAAAPDQSRNHSRRDGRSLSLFGCRQEIDIWR